VAKTLGYRGAQAFIAEASGVSATPHLTRIIAPRDRLRSDAARHI
jgi:hypothetical protein